MMLCLPVWFHHPSVSSWCLVAELHGTIVFLHLALGSHLYGDEDEGLQVCLATSRTALV